MRKVVFVAVVAVLLIGLLPMGTLAQSATGQTWSTSITYYTPSSTGGTLQVRYYKEGDGTPINATPIPLSPHKAGSLYIGSVSGIPDPFKGAAVLEADVAIIATAVNIAGTDGYARPLYTGFDPAKASKNFFIPTILKKFKATTLVSVQNVETSPIQATLKVYSVGSSTPSWQQTYNIPGQSAKLVSVDDMGLSNFSGSGKVEADGKVVAAAQETADSGRYAAAFEGLSADAGAETIYMASMLCKAFGGQTSFYAIQNVGASTANVEIDFYDKLGAKVATATGISIPKDSKKSVNPCDYSGTLGKSGSAVIRSTNSIPLIAMGKVSGGGLTTTAFLGESAGAMKVGAPYIRWKADPSAGERAYVAVMNVGNAPATNVVVTYYDKAGAAAATETLPSMGQFIKKNSNWKSASGTNTDFGVPPGGYGGAIEVTADQPVVVVVRVAKEMGSDVLGEDYNGVPVP